MSNLIIPGFIVKSQEQINFEMSYYMKVNELIYYGYDPYMFPEIWAPIDLFDIKRGLYMVSTYGRVFSFATNCELSYLPNKGYKEVALQTRDNFRKTYGIHRLVAYTFIPRTEEDDYYRRNVINHKNLIRNCNFVWNLEYVTQRENIIHAIENNAVGQDYSHEYSGLWSKGERTYGENNGMSVWTEEQVHCMCKEIESGKSYGEALIAAGLENTENNRFNVSHIVQGKRWKHIGSQYNLQPKKQIDKSQYVVPVCELLEKGYSSVEIIDTLDIPCTNRNQLLAFIGGIRRRKYYTDISKRYNW